MAIKANQEKVMVEVQLDYSPAQAQRIAQQIDAFQRKQQNSEQVHQDKLRRQAEAHNQRLAQAEEKALKAAENRQKAAQAKILAGTKSWSAKMTDSVNSLRTAIVAMGVAFVSAQVIGGIKSLATEALSLAADLNTFSKFTGLSVESLSALSSIAKVTGVDMSSFQGSLVGIAAKLQDARDGATEAQQSFRNLGINFETATLDEIIQKLFDAAKNTDNLGKISKVASDTGAEQFGRLATYADNYTGALRKSRDEFGNLGKSGAEAISNLNKQLDTIKARLSVSLQTSIATAAPQIEAAVAKLAEAIAKINWVGLIEGGTKTAEVATKAGSSLAQLAVDSSRPIAALSALLAVIVATPTAFSNAVSKMLAKGTALDEMEAIVARALNSLWGIPKRLYTIGQALEKSLLFQAITPVLKALSKLAWFLTAITAAWDYFTARVAGATPIQSGLYSIGKAFGSIVDIVTWGSWDITDALDAWLARIKKVKDELKPMATTGAMADYSSRFKIQTEAFVSDPGANTVVAPFERIIAGTKVAPPIDPYTKKLDELREAQAAASKELAHWNKLLLDGKIDFETFNKLVSDLTSNIKGSELKALEKLIAVFDGSAIMQGKARKRPDSIELFSAPQLAQLVDYRTELEKIVDKVIQYGDYIELVLSPITSAWMGVYDYLIEAEQNRINAQQAANQLRIDAINEELEMLNRLGFGNTMWAKRKEKEAQEAEKRDSARLRRLQKERQKLAIADATINAIASFATNLKAYPFPLSAIMGGLSLAAGMAQVGAIASQQFELGGKVIGNPYQDRTQILAQGGEYVVNRRASERNANVLESMNNGATVGGGRSINIVINGNVLGEDRWVRDRLMPEISRALQEGHSLNA